MRAILSRRGFVTRSVAIFENWMPDPFVIAVALTVLASALAAIFAPHGDARTIINAWYNGVFGILSFAFQMVLILVTGHALASAPSIRRGLRRLVSVVRTAPQAIWLVFAVVTVVGWVNWGAGLVVGAFLAREIARRVRLDYGWLIAATYSAWSVINSGLSSSVALTQASHGNALNIVEKLTGHILPLRDTIFAPFTWVPALLVALVMPAVFIAIRPAERDIVIFVPPEEDVAEPEPDQPRSIARRIDRSRLGSLVIVAFGIAYLALAWSHAGFSMDLDRLILVFLLLGLLLQGNPMAYANAVSIAVRQVGPMILQYPIYGGIMGIMTVTGLAGSISRLFVAVATPGTLPFYSYLSSIVITLLVPSAGGHWAVQGPFVVPAALTLHASLPATAMGVAVAENVANMLQPFWCVPLVAIAGIGIQRVLGYTVITFLITGLIYGAAMLLLV